MTISLMFYALLVGALLGAAALVFEQAASWLRLDRRWVWLIATIAVPILTLIAPWRAVPMAALSIAPARGVIGSGAQAAWRRATVEPIFRAVAEPPAGSGADKANALATWAWIGMSSLALARYAGGRVVLARRRRRWIQVNLQGHTVLVAPDAGPAIIGCWSTAIVVPAWAFSLDAPYVALLLAHEREHERARDPLLVHLSQIALVLMPWNPFTWWMGGRLRSAVEMDCDARVLARRETPADHIDYAGLLVTVASRTTAGGAPLSPALIERPSVLRRRIAAMHALQPRAVRTKFTIAGLVTCGLIGAVVTFPVPRLGAHWTPPAAPAAMPPAPAPTFAAPTMTEGRDRDRVNRVTPNGVRPTLTTDAGREPRTTEMPDLEAQGAPAATPSAPPTPAPTARASVVATDGALAQGSGTARVPGTDQVLGVEAYRTTSGVQFPVVIRSVRPVYTSEARDRKIQGVVQMEAVVDENGAVRDVRVTRSLDSIYGLDEEAMKAARLWLFRPALSRAQNPVPIIITLELEFRLPPFDGGFGAGAYRMGSGITNPVVLKDQKPVYTSAAMREKIQGVVQMEAVVDENGLVRDVRVTRSLDKVYGLDQETMKAARLWLFRPAVDRGGKPVPIIITLELEFRLDRSKS